MTKKVYYAHPLSIYNTKQEERDVETLLHMGLNVLNPNGAEHEAGYKDRGMEYFREVVNTCSMLAFRGFPDGSIPAGIAKEIDYAKEAGCLIIELPSCISRRTLTVDATREVLRESGYR